MASDKVIIRCPHCHHRIYIWDRKKARRDKLMKTTHFEPIPILGELLGIKAPKPKDYIDCPLCQGNLYDVISDLFYKGERGKKWMENN